MSTVDRRFLEAPDYSEYEEYMGQSLYSEILPNLWMGGTADADVNHVSRRVYVKPPAPIGPTDFDTVVTAYADARPVDWYVKEIRFGYWDSALDRDTVPILLDIARSALADWKAGKRVLIRCQAGWNRSGLLTALVLILDGMEPGDAIGLMRAKRTRYVLCNRDFEKWLVHRGWEDDENDDSDE